MAARHPKYLVRVRSFTRPTRTYDRGGWRNTVRWTSWETVRRCETYATAAAVAGADHYHRAAVFWCGKAYWQRSGEDGRIIDVKVGADALLMWRTL